jgi:hypothetical protein
MNHIEDDEQRAFFDWCQRKSVNGKPLSRVCYAIPNGGNRNSREAARMKAQGVLSGVADVFLALAVIPYHGLYIEFKNGDNSLSKNQAEFKNDVVENGYLHVTCYSCEDAIDEVELYLSGFCDTPPVRLEKFPGEYPFYVSCRRMSTKFKTKRGAIGWLRRRGFDEFGNRI